MSSSHRRSRSGSSRVSASSSPTTSPWRPSARSAAIRSSSAWSRSSSSRAISAASEGSEARSAKAGPVQSAERLAQDRAGPARAPVRQARLAQEALEPRRVELVLGRRGGRSRAGGPRCARRRGPSAGARCSCAAFPSRPRAAARPRPGRSGRPPGPAGWPGRSGGRGPAVAWARRAGSAAFVLCDRDRAEHLETHPRTVRSGAAVGKVRPARKALRVLERSTRAGSAGVLVESLEALGDGRASSHLQASAIGLQEPGATVPAWARRSQRGSWSRSWRPRRSPAAARTWSRDRLP